MKKIIAIIAALGLFAQVEVYAGKLTSQSGTPHYTSGHVIHSRPLPGISIEQKREYLRAFLNRGFLKFNPPPPIKDVFPLSK